MGVKYTDLIKRFSPLNRETNVSIDREIEFGFYKAMKEESFEKNIHIKVTNGEYISFKTAYDKKKLTLTITPDEPLQYGKNYTVRINGGKDGIEDAFEGYFMEKDRVIDFTTEPSSVVGVISGVEVSVQTNSLELSWNSVFSVTEEPVVYSVEIQSNSEPVWPESGNNITTDNNSMTIRKSFEPGTYSASVTARSGTQEFESDVIEFIIEESIKEPDGSVESDSGDTGSDNPGSGHAGSDNIFSFGVEDVYPRDGAVHITPESVVILFDDDVDEDTVDDETVYVINGKNKANIGPLDLMTKYNHSNSVGNMTVEPEDNFVKISGSFLPNAEYTVIVRGEVKSKSGNSLGRTYSMSFLTEFPRLYGDAELVRSDLGGFVSGISDRILYKIMRDNSEYAYDVASQSGAMADNTANSAPLFVHQYVRYKTAYDLMVNAQIKETSSAGSRISLGDLSVDKDNSTSNTQSLMRDFKDQIKVWEDALRGQSNRGYAQTRSVVKGENTTYPAFLTRAEYRELGE